MTGKHDNGIHFIGGILIGGVIGAVAGILLAPKSGKELRWDIKEKGNEALDGAKKLCSDAQTKAKAVFDGAKSGVGDLRKTLSL